MTDVVVIKDKEIRINDMKKKKHHIVPQFYLKEFSKNKINITGFIKSRGEIRNDLIINNICYINNFYTLKEANPYIIETDLLSDNEEPRLKRVVKKTKEVDSTASFTTLDSYFKQDIVNSILLQYMRTNVYRDLLINEQKADIEEEIKPLLKRLYMMTGINNFELGLTVDKAKVHAYELLNNFRSGELNELTDKILRDEMTFLFSLNNDFYTSDTPVIINKNESNNNCTANSIYDYKTIYFPISPQIAILITNNDDINYSIFNIKIRILSDDEICSCNDLEKESCYKYLFSYNNNFDKLSNPITTYE